ncbi:hypothetical protein SAMN05446037_100315 [Anaerovirgula multivorans]|uniref:Replication-associated protein ORF2/G2P domain-containing protein n=1 Tax=Anaerovirgula multivorans TaxID=312168 RepID=A0A239B5W7_9FIRM|nr:hypothetical protein [Anaerovirgula multivorans]SNS03062.1 hypothetical protein SAMN05446037_100315 [Anaerovirgula multivorans]
MLDLLSTNLHLKIAGKKIILKKYSRSMQFNYGVKPRLKSPRGESSHSRDNFNKAISRARNKIFDIVSCNVNAIPDFEGNIQLPKFLTLTFAENITDLKTANAEFTKFNKRLSYQLYKVNRNVLKYICIPEFQKRGAVHYHVLYFNMPYVDFKELSKIWGQGYVFVEGITEKQNIEDFAKYTCKYMSKENSKGEDNYKIYQDKEMLNTKRYFTSRGLNKPENYKLDIDKGIYDSFLIFLKDYHKDNLEYSNEFIGHVEINTYEIDKQSILESIKNAVNSIIDAMKYTYSKKEKLTKYGDKNFLSRLQDNYYENLYIQTQWKRKGAVA